MSTMAQLRQKIAWANEYGPAFSEAVEKAGGRHINWLRKARERHPPHSLTVEASEHVLNQMKVFRPGGRWFYLSVNGPHQFWFEEEDDFILCKLSFRERDAEERPKVPVYYSSDYYEEWENAFEDLD